MKIIFTKDVKGQGKKDEIKEVKDGYAKNFLIKNGYAVPLTNTSIHRLAEDNQKRQVEEEKNKQQANDIKKKLENLKLKFKLKTGSLDKTFGSISTKQISDELKVNGYTIDKKNIILDHQLSTIGYHQISIQLYKDIIADIKIEIIKE